MKFRMKSTGRVFSMTQLASASVASFIVISGVSSWGTGLLLSAGAGGFALFSFVLSYWGWWKALKWGWSKVEPIIDGWTSLAEQVNGQVKTRHFLSSVVGEATGDNLPFSINNVDNHNEQHDINHNGSYRKKLRVCVYLPDVVPPKAVLKPEGSNLSESISNLVWGDMTVGDEKFDSLVSLDGLVPGRDEQVIALMPAELRDTILTTLIEPQKGSPGFLLNRTLVVNFYHDWDVAVPDPALEIQVINTLERLQRLGSALVDAYTQFSSEGDWVRDRLRERAQTDSCESVRHKSLLHLIEMAPDHAHPWPLSIDEARYVFNYSKTTDVIIAAIEQLEDRGNEQALRDLRFRAENNKLAGWHQRAEHAIRALEDRLSGGSLGGLSLVDDSDNQGSLSLSDSMSDVGALDLVEGVPAKEQLTE